MYSFKIIMDGKEYGEIPKWISKNILTYSRSKIEKKPK